MKLSERFCYSQKINVFIINCTISAFVTCKWYTVGDHMMVIVSNLATSAISAKQQEQKLGSCAKA